LFFQDLLEADRIHAENGPAFMGLILVLRPFTGAALSVPANDWRLGRQAHDRRLRIDGGSYRVKASGLIAELQLEQAMVAAALDCQHQVPIDQSDSV
jgi:hypothetical protein